MLQFTVLGSLNYDLVTYTKRIPEAGETYRADHFETHIGGKGLNQTISIAKLIPEINNDNRVRMIGNVGDDLFGNELRGSLINHGVDVENVKPNKGEKSGTATIIVEMDTGENRILITEGANGKSDYGEAELDNLFPKTPSCEFVVFQNEIPGTVKIIKWLASSRSDITHIVYNPSPYYSYSIEALASVDILLVNEIESMAIAKDTLMNDEYQNFEQLTDSDPISGFSKLALNLKGLINQKKSAIVVITLGPLGCVFTIPDTNETDFVESIKIERVVDTTGAGDTFLGAFLTRLCGNHDIKKAVRFASTAASLAIQKNGASNSIPTYKEVVIASL